MPEPAMLFLVHHSPERADKLARQIESYAHVEVRVASPQLSAADYADLAADPAVGAVIIEQDLGAGSGLGFEGIDVAEYLRRTRPGLPLYLLADSDEGLAGREAVVEAVIPEGDFSLRCPVYAQRILRAVGRYVEAMTDRDRRYRELVVQRLAGELTAKGEEELASYRAEIELPFAGSVLEHARVWESSLDEERRLLEQFSSELRDLLSELS